jgi:hypothetical protein
MKIGQMRGRTAVIYEGFLVEAHHVWMQSNRPLADRMQAILASNSPDGLARLMRAADVSQRGPLEAAALLRAVALGQQRDAAAGDMSALPGPMTQQPATSAALTGQLQGLLAAYDVQLNVNQSAPLVAELMAAYGDAEVASRHLADLEPMGEVEMLGLHGSLDSAREAMQDWLETDDQLLFLMIGVPKHAGLKLQPMIAFGIPVYSSNPFEEPVLLRIEYSDAQGRDPFKPVLSASGVRDIKDLYDWHIGPIGSEPLPAFLQEAIDRTRHTPAVQELQRDENEFLLAYGERLSSRLRLSADEEDLFWDFVVQGIPEEALRFNESEYLANFAAVKKSLADKLGALGITDPSQLHAQFVGKVRAVYAQTEIARGQELSRLFSGGRNARFLSEVSAFATARVFSRLSDHAQQLQAMNYLQALLTAAAMEFQKTRTVDPERYASGAADDLDPRNYQIGVALRDALGVTTDSEVIAQFLRFCQERGAL